MTGRNHLSIGEVLSLLKEEFPDVTISKIRFLESQGLVDPERTPSGYRKFYEPDIERLRWVLRQQRDAFLPLKVIKGRLLEGYEADEHEGAYEMASELGELEAPGVSRGAGGAVPEQVRPADEAAKPNEVAKTKEAVHRAVPRSQQLFDVGPPRVAPPVPEMDKPRAAQRSPKRRSGVARHEWVGDGSTPAEGHDEDELSLEELVSMTGAEPSMVHELERFGLVSPRMVAGALLYSAEAALITRLAAAFARHGVEARHLRAYKGAAEREAGMVQQVIMPLLRQRNPEARRAANDVAVELSQLGGELRAALLRSALAELR